MKRICPPAILKCLLCNKEFHHLGSHIWHGHKMLARDYKAEFGLPYKMSLIDEGVHAKKRLAFEKNRKKYLDNFVKSGTKYQFKKGNNGLRRISQHERETNIERIKNVNLSKASKFETCVVCRMKFNHIESHLYNEHRLLAVK